MSQHRTQSSYQVYVLRSWLEGDPASGSPPVRRYSLEDPQTRQRRGFADLQALMGFLAAEAEQEAVTSPPAPGTDGQEAGNASGSQ